jgi:hypothetical protein
MQKKGASRGRKRFSAYRAQSNAATIRSHLAVRFTEASAATPPFPGVFPICKRVSMTSDPRSAHANVRSSTGYRERKSGRRVGWRKQETGEMKEEQISRPFSILQ